MTAIRLALALALMAVLGACAETTITSNKAAGYSANLGKVAIIYIDDRNLGQVSQTHSGTGAAMTESSLSEKMKDARGAVADKMAKFLPDVVKQSGIDQTFVKIENSDVTPQLLSGGFLAKLPPQALAERNVLVITPTGGQVDCYNGGCTAVVILTTRLIDKTSRKIGWTSQTTIHDGPVLPFGRGFPDGTAADYWKVNLGKLRTDGLIF
jgi:hypothetical protein